MGSPTHTHPGRAAAILILMLLLFLPALSVNGAFNGSSIWVHEKNGTTVTEAMGAAKHYVGVAKAAYCAGEEIVITSNVPDGLLQIIKPDGKSIEMIFSGGDTVFATDELGHYMVFMYTPDKTMETSFIVRERAENISRGDGWVFVERGGHFANDVSLKDRHGKDFGSLVTSNKTPGSFDAAVKTEGGSIELTGIRAGEKPDIMIGNYGAPKTGAGTGIMTPVISVEGLDDFGGAKLIFPKKGRVDAVLVCGDIDHGTFECLTGWSEHPLAEFGAAQNSTHFWMFAPHFTGYAGGDSNMPGDSSGLIISNANESGSLPASTAANPVYVRVQASYYAMGNNMSCPPGETRVNGSIVQDISMAKAANASKADHKYFGVHAADLDSDSLIEIVAVGTETHGGSDYGVINVYNFTGGTSLALEANRSFRVARNKTYATSVRADDVDGDGRKEIVVAGWAQVKNSVADGGYIAFVHVYNYTTGANKKGAGTITLERKANFSYGGGSCPYGDYTKWAKAWGVKILNATGSSRRYIAIVGESGCYSVLGTDPPVCSEEWPCKQQAFFAIYNVSGSSLARRANDSFLNITNQNFSAAFALDGPSINTFYMGGYHMRKQSGNYQEGFMSRISFNPSSMAASIKQNTSFKQTDNTVVRDLDYYGNLTAPSKNDEVVLVGAIYGSSMSSFMRIYNVSGSESSAMALENYTVWNSHKSAGTQGVDARAVHICEMNWVQKPRFNKTAGLSWHSPLYHREICVGGYDNNYLTLPQYSLPNPANWSYIRVYNMTLSNRGGITPPGSSRPYRASTPQLEESEYWYMRPSTAGMPGMNETTMSVVEGLFSMNLDNRTAQKSRDNEIASVGWESTSSQDRNFGMPWIPNNAKATLGIYRYTGFVCNISFNDTATAGPGQGVSKQFRDWYPMWFNGSANYDVRTESRLWDWDVSPPGPQGNYTFYKEFTETGTYAYNVSCGGDPRYASLSATDTITITHSQAPPRIMELVLNATTPQNTTNDNITAYVNSTDINGDGVTHVFNWKKDGIPLAVLNLPFDVSVSSAATGAVKDYSGNDHNGTLGGNTVWTSSGKTGGGFYFDGNYDNINLTSHSLRLTNSTTLMMWVKIDKDIGSGGGSTRFPGLFAQTSTAGSWDDFIGFTQASGNKICYEDIDGIYRQSNAFANYNTGDWLHVTIAMDEYRVPHFYANAFKNGSAPASTNYVTLNYLGMGYGGHSRDGSFNGTIDDVRLYNRTLSAAQILQIYNETRHGYAMNSTIVSGETETNDVWELTVTPLDRYGEGSSETRNISISGIPAPLITGLVLNSTEGKNSTDENISAYVSSDESSANTFIWKRNGQSVLLWSVPMDVKVTGNENDAVKDYSGNDHNGTLGGNTVWTSSGKTGGGFYFDGKYDNIDFSSHSLRLTNSTTLMMWVKLDRAIAWGSHVRYPGLFAYTDTAGSWDDYVGFTNDGGGDRINYEDVDGNYRQSDPFEYTTGDWLHVAISMNKHRGPLFYANGIRYGDRDDLTTNYVNLRYLGLGYGGSTNDASFNGTMDDIRLYNMTLNDAQIEKIYNETRHGHTNRSTIVSGMTNIVEEWEVEVWPSNSYKRGEPEDANMTILNATTSIFSAYYDDSGTIASGGAGNFGVHVRNTNNTVLLEIDGGNVTPVDYHWVDFEKDTSASNPPKYARVKHSNYYSKYDLDVLNQSEISYFGWFNSKTSLSDAGDYWYSYNIFKPQYSYLLGWSGWDHDGWECNVWNSSRQGQRAYVWKTRPLVAGEWVHVGCVFNGTALELYINGVLEAYNYSIPHYRIQNRTLEVPPYQYYDLFIGDKNQNQGYNLTWDGGIDEVRVYNRSLNSTEVLEIYRSERLPNASLPGDSLILWMPFNQSAGEKVADMSGMGNDAELVSATWVNSYNATYAFSSSGTYDYKWYSWNKYGSRINESALRQYEVMSAAIPVYDVTLLDWGEADDNQIGISGHEYDHRAACNFTVDSKGTSLKAPKVNLSHMGYDAKGADNDNLHYSNASCTLNRSLGGDDYEFSCLFRIQYYAKNGTWKCNVSVGNTAGLTNNSAAASDTATVPSVTSIVVNETHLGFGSAAPGSNTSSASYLTAINVGNTLVDIKINGSNLLNTTGGTYAIGVKNMTFNKTIYKSPTRKGSTSADPSVSPRKLQKTQYTWSSLNLKPFNASTMAHFYEANVTVAFRVAVPAGQSTRRYTSTIQADGIYGG